MRGFVDRYLSAEFIRARSSALQWLPLLAVPLVTMTLLLSLAVSPSVDATGVLMWQAMYATGLAAPLAVLFGAVSESREKRARHGGTQWRGVSEHRQRAARIIVVLCSLAAFHLLNFGATWLLVVRREGSAQVLLLGVFAFIGAVGVAGLGAALARVSNLVVAVGAFFVWQIVGALRPVVEGSAWWAWPNAWPIRLVLPVMGVHQNAVPLEPGAPLTSESPWSALGLCVLLAVAGLAASLLVPDRVSVPRRARSGSGAGVVVSGAFAPATVARSKAGRPRSLLAMSMAALTPALVGCTALTFIVMGLVSLVYPSSYLHGFFVFAILPIGAGLLPVLVWPKIECAWAVMRTEYQKCARVHLSWLLLCVVVVCVVAFLLGLPAGGVLIDESRRLLLSILSGYVVVLVALLVLLRLGLAASLAVTFIVAIVSVTLGGDVLANTPLWALAFPSWADTATNTSRVLIALFIGGSLVGLLHWRAERVLGSWV